MPLSSDDPSASNSQESTSPQLGLRNPLLPPSPLGQRNSSPAFRLGSRSLNVLAPLRTLSWRSDWQSHPPIAQRRPSHLLEKEQDRTSPPLSSQPSPHPIGKRVLGTLSAQVSDASKSSEPFESGGASGVPEESEVSSSSGQIQDSSIASTPTSLQTKTHSIDNTGKSGDKVAQSPPHSYSLLSDNPTQAKSVTPQDGLLNQPLRSDDSVGKSISTKIQPSSHTPSNQIAKAPLPTSAAAPPEDHAVIHRSPSSHQLSIERGDPLPPVSISEEFVPRTTEYAEQISAEQKPVFADSSRGKSGKHSNTSPRYRDGLTDNSSSAQSQIQAQSDSQLPTGISHTPLTPGEKTNAAKTESFTAHSGSAEPESIPQVNKSNSIPTVQTKQSGSAPSPSESTVSEESIELPASTSASFQETSGHDPLPAIQASLSPTETPSPTDLQAFSKGDFPSKGAVEHHAQPPAVQAEGTLFSEKPASRLQPDRSTFPVKGSTSDSRNNRSTVSSNPSNGDRNEVSNQETSFIQRQFSRSQTEQFTRSADSKGIEATTSYSLTDPPSLTTHRQSVPAESHTPATRESSSSAIDSEDVRQIIPFASGKTPTQVAQPKVASDAEHPFKQNLQPDISDFGDAVEGSRQQQTQLSSVPEIESSSIQQTELSSGKGAPQGNTLEGGSSNSVNVQLQTDTAAIPPSQAHRLTEERSPISDRDISANLHQLAEPERSPLPAHNTQGSSNSDTVEEQARSEFPGIQRSTTSTGERTDPCDSSSTSADYSSHSTYLSKSAIEPPSSELKTSQLSAIDSDEQTPSTKSFSTSSTSVEAARRSPDSQPSPATAAPLQPPPLDSGQSTNQIEPPSFNSTGLSESTSEIQRAQSSPSKEQADHQSASLQSPQQVTPLRTEEVSTVSVEPEEVAHNEASLTSDTSRKQQTPITPIQTSQQDAPSIKPIDSDSRTDEEGFVFESPSETLASGDSSASNPGASIHPPQERPLQPPPTQLQAEGSSENGIEVANSKQTRKLPDSTSIARRAVESVDSSSTSPAGDNFPSQPVDTVKSSNGQTIDSTNLNQASVQDIKGDTPSSSTTSTSKQSASLIQRIPSLMNTAFNVIGTVITNSLSEPSASAPETSSPSTHLPAGEIRRSPEANKAQLSTQLPNNSVTDSSPTRENSTPPIQAKNRPHPGSEILDEREASLDITSNKTEKPQVSELKSSETTAETTSPVSLDSPARSPLISKAQLIEPSVPEALGEISTQLSEMTQTDRGFNQTNLVESSQPSTDLTMQAGQTSLKSEEARTLQASAHQQLDSPRTEQNPSAITSSSHEQSIQTKSLSRADSHQSNSPSTTQSLPVPESTKARDSVQEQRNSPPKHGQPGLNGTAVSTTAADTSDIFIATATNSTPIQTRPHPVEGDSSSPLDSDASLSSQESSHASSNPSAISDLNSSVVRSEGNDVINAANSTSTSEAIQRSLAPETQQPLAGHFPNVHSSNLGLPTASNSQTQNSTDSEQAANHSQLLEQSEAPPPNPLPSSTSTHLSSSPESSSEASNSGSDSPVETNPPLVSSPAVNPVAQRSQAPERQQPPAGHLPSVHSSDSELLPASNKEIQPSTDPEESVTHPNLLQQTTVRSTHIHPESTSSPLPSSTESSSETNTSGSDRSSDRPQAISQAPPSTAPTVQPYSDIEATNISASANEDLDPETITREDRLTETEDLTSDKPPTTYLGTGEGTPALNNDKRISQPEGHSALSTMPPIQRERAPHPTGKTQHVRADAEPEPLTSQSNPLSPPAVGERDSSLDAPEIEHSSSTELPITSPIEQQLETTIHRKDRVDNSSGIQTDRAVSTSDDSQQFQPTISEQLPSNNRSVSSPSVQQSAEVQKKPDELVSEPRHIQSSEPSNTSRSESAIAASSTQQQLTQFPEEKSTDSNSVHLLIQQQPTSSQSSLFSGSTTQSTPTAEVSNTDQNFQSPPYSQRATQQASANLYAGISNSSAANSSRNKSQVNSSPDFNGLSQQTEQMSSKMSHHSIARSVSPDDEIRENTSTDSDTGFSSQLDPPSGTKNETLLHQTSSPTSYVTDSAIQRRSTNPISSNASDDGDPQSSEAWDRYDDNRRSPLPQLPRVLKPIAALRPLIQPSSSSSESVELPQATSQKTQPTGSESQSDSVIQPSLDIAKDNQGLNISTSPQINKPTSSHNTSSQKSASPNSTSSNQASSKQELPLPEQWSSIADLLSVPSVSISPSSSSTAPSAADSQIQAKFAQETSEIPTIQPKWDESLSADRDDTIDPETLNAHLDTLAREIYGMLRLKLERERERNGSSYNGRLPW